MDTTPSPLAAFVAAAWDRHPSEPGGVADGLRERAALLGADADGAAALGLAEHVWLAHLHDAAGFRDFLDALPHALAGSEPTAAPLRRARWVLAAAEHRPAGDLPDAPRWRALQNLWSLWCAQGRIGDAQALLASERPAALAHPDPAARKALAASCNNLASDLREGPRGNAQRDAFMLALAAAARTLWASAGTWVQIERADHLLAHCHAALGLGAAALEHARACLALIQQHEGDPQADALETFFAHEALAWAQRAAGDTVAEAAEIAHMRARLAAIGDDSLRPWCERALAALEK